MILGIIKTQSRPINFLNSTDRLSGTKPVKSQPVGLKSRPVEFNNRFKSRPVNFLNSASRVLSTKPVKSQPIELKSGPVEFDNWFKSRSVGLY